MTNTSAPRCGHCGAWLLPTDAVHYPVRRGEIDAGNPLLGTVVDGKYRLQGVLGRGGLGTVFRAQHIGSLVTVALKLLHPRFSERPEYRRALLPEARRAATVTHEHCARLLDVGEADEGVAYLAMELVDGKTLEQLVRPGPLQPSHATDVLAQVADALVAIHAAGLVHCDLSPRNVMVSARGGALHVKVLDFGIARSVTLAGQSKAPNEFAGFGNPAFSAPELLAGGDVDPRADLYSLGMVACVLLTGRVPVDDSDPRRAAAAAAAGEPTPWSPVPGVPRRLANLIRRCLSHDPHDRPYSAATVARELAIVRGARRPALVRSAIAAAAISVIVTLAAGEEPVTPFLRPLSGSPLVLADGPLPFREPPLDLTSRKLESVGFHFGGFAASRLRADLARDGVPLMPQSPLRPETDSVTGTLRLSATQPQWHDVLQTIARESAAGPVDLTFVVPGSAPLGTARLRLDDDPPSVAFRLLDAEKGLTNRTKLEYEVGDSIGVAAAVVHLSFASGAKVDLPLPVAGSPLPLGEQLAAKMQLVGALGAGDLVVSATDRAGNTQRSTAVAFPAADVAAPSVVDVTGGAGEPFLPMVGGRVAIRVRLSAAEDGCTLAVRRPDEQPSPPVPLGGSGPERVAELQLDRAVDGRAKWEFTVTDATGNSTVQELPVDVRDRTIRPQFQTDGRTARVLGDELVVADGGAVVRASCGPWAIVDARVELAAPAPATTGSGVHIGRGGNAVDLELAPLPPGKHVLRLELREGDAEQALQRSHAVPLRVLPAVIEIRVPASRARYLPGLLQSGMLARRGDTLVDGVGWVLDPALRPYVRGSLWIGATAPVSLPLPAPAPASDALLPPVSPVVGRNVLAVELSDVLDRPLRIVRGDEKGAPGAPESRVVVADFWWNEAGPELIGQELLVEYGQPASFEVRFPLPYEQAEAGELRLSVAQVVIAASRVTTVPPAASVVAFELPFAVWSVAAQLADKTREQYAAQLEGHVDVAIATPAFARPQPLTLRLRTTRSTLRPLALADLRELPPAIGSIRLLPVIAPSGAFEEPVPVSVPPAPRLSPPRASFRPQVAVAVTNMADVLLQDHELECGQARAIAAVAPSVQLRDRRRCVHFEDSLGTDRLLPENLLPAAAASAPADAVLTGVSFYQAYTLCCLLGIAVADDPEAFRLPLGCELDLAAYGGATIAACNGASAHGSKVPMAPFLAAEGRLQRGEPLTAALERASGDVVPTAFGEDFVGLDFGVREWVFDLPHIPGAEILMSQWIRDQVNHLGEVQRQARGVPDRRPDPVGPLRHIGVVRGLPLGQRSGLVAVDGTPLTAGALEVVPASVPGVLRTEQLRRDGGDLLASASDPRLRTIGFRVVGIPAALASARGRR